MSQPTSIAFLGLGTMGQRMALRLVQAGHRLSVYNRTPAKAAALVQAGATSANSAAEAVKGAQVVCTNLASPAAIDALALGPSGFVSSLEQGALWIDFSTIGPSDALRYADLCTAHGANFAECPVTGSKNGAAAGTLIGMFGGSAELLARVNTVLSVLCEKVVHVGPVGSAAAAKLSGNLIIASLLEGFAEALSLAERYGVQGSTLLEIIQSSGYRSPYFDFKGKAMLNRDYDTHFEINLMHKDLRLFQEAADARNFPAPQAALLRDQFARAKAAGLGALDIAALGELHRPGLK